MWTIETTTFSVNDIEVNESLYALGNGYLGIRGAYDEWSSPSVRGSYINGFYENIPYSYSEKLHGFPDFTQRQLNVFEAQYMTIYLDGEEVVANEENISNFHYKLDMKEGYTTRSYHYRIQSGKVAVITVKKMIAMTKRSRLVIDVDINFEGTIHVDSIVNYDVYPHSNDDDPRVGSHSDKMLYVKQQSLSGYQADVEGMTMDSDLSLWTRCDYRFASDYHVRSRSDASATTCSVTAERALNMTKYVDYRSSRHFLSALEHDHAINDLSFDDYIDLQKTYYDDFWDHADIVIEGDVKTQNAIRYSIFQIHQSVGKDAITNISAKGLTGEGYEGHTFWDTEIYIIPSLLTTQSHLVKALLTYRYGLLDAARSRAKELGHARGSKFPWRTITGPECSSFFPAGTAQYHINGDIAYSIIQYYLASDDLEFIESYGLEMLLEVSLLWLDMGHFSDGKFCIDAVTGPDEYSCVVNNNYYTNVLAKYSLKWTVKLLKQGDKAIVDALLARLKVSVDDIQAFEEAEAAMYLPFDENLGIFLQDEHFTKKKVWDLESTPKENFPLLLHYHPLTIYRYQVLKQADTVLANLLVDDGISDDVLAQTYRYYKGITTHDSSLSQCVYGMMASRIGEREEAVRFFNKSVSLDLDNLHGNTKDGLHMANMGGTVMGVLYGFLGMRLKDRGISFRPCLPKEWESLSLKVHVKNRVIHVKCYQNHTDFNLVAGDPLTIFVNDEAVELV